MSDDKAAMQPESDESRSGTESPKNPNSEENLSAGAEGVTAENIADLLGEPHNDSATDDVNGNDLDDQGAQADQPEDELTSLQAQLENANAKADENMDLALRTHAEMENLRKRQSRELENAHKYALDKMAEELLPVRDTLELGVAAAEDEQAELSKIVEGTELTLKMLTQALEKFNILEVNPLGEKFNPDLHQAISMQEGTDQPANTVLTVMQKGYTLNDRLLRPAMVVIAK